MKILSPIEGIAIAVVFGIAMVILVACKTKTERHVDGFLVADRVVPTWQAAFSIAVSWVWAPAIFVCSMQAYTHGLPGIFWFTVPNVVCFFIFAPMAKRLRQRMPNGYTFPEFVAQRFAGHHGAHLAFLGGYLLNMVGAIVANSYAGGALLTELTGIELHTAIIMVSAIALSYSLISGLKASIFTDVVQMMLVLGLAFILVPGVFLSVDGASEKLLKGLAGRDGSYGSVLDPRVAFAMGIPMTITLLTGPLSDQMFIQRAMAVRFQDITKTFVYGGLLFGLIPLSLSLLGFIGASLAAEGVISVHNTEMIGPIVISHTLPIVALYAFTCMALAALSSTLDSALCAVSSLASIDIFKRYVGREVSSQEVCRVARLAMITIAIVGTGIALCKPNMLLTFLVTGCITGSLYFPAVAALYATQVSARGVVWSIVVALAVSIPFSIFANTQGDELLIVLSSLSSIIPGLILLLVARLKRPLAH